MHIYRINDGDEKHIGNVNINLKRLCSGQRSRNWYRVVDMVFLLYSNFYVRENMTNTYAAETGRLVELSPLPPEKSEVT